MLVNEIAPSSETISFAAQLHCDGCVSGSHAQDCCRDVWLHHERCSVRQVQVSLFSPLGL